MKSRREFIKMSAGAVTLGALGSPTALGAPTPANRKVWVLSDLHSGLQEGGKDGAEWFESACKDMREAKFKIDYAMTLGDISHRAVEDHIQRYIDVRDGSGVAKWYEIAGNHEYHDGKAEAYIRMVRSIDPYSVIDGNIAWFFISDEAPGVAGNLTEKSCQWLEKQLAEHADKTTIVCSHQLVKDTTTQSERPQRHIQPADRIAGIIAKSKIDLWLSGHEHHSRYSKEHICRKDDTTYINVASMSHAYNTHSSQSCLLEFVPGAKEIIARRREHDGNRFLPDFEVKIPLRHPLKPDMA
jgi:hypothetical protein